jgi:hypothetical protein
MSENTMGTGDTGTDSSVINELRKQNRELAKRVADAEQARASAAESMLTAKGFGKLSSVFLNQVEGFPTEASVAEFLADLGLDAKETEVPEPEPQVEAESEQATPASELGQQVASAAGADGQPDVIQRLLEANSAADIDAIMADSGLTVQT